MGFIDPPDGRGPRPEVAGCHHAPNAPARQMARTTRRTAMRWIAGTPGKWQASGGLSRKRVVRSPSYHPRSDVGVLECSGMTQLWLGKRPLHSNGCGSPYRRSAGERMRRISPRAKATSCRRTPQGLLYLGAAGLNDAATASIFSNSRAAISGCSAARSMRSPRSCSTLKSSGFSREAAKPWLLPVWLMSFT